MAYSEFVRDFCKKINRYVQIIDELEETHQETTVSYDTYQFNE